MGEDVHVAGGAGAVCPRAPWGPTATWQPQQEGGASLACVRARALPRGFHSSWMLGWGWLIRASVACILEIVKRVKAEE